MTRLMKIIHLAALTAASALVLATTTEAQTPRSCAPRDHVVLRLADGYGETRQSMGLGGNNAVIEVFASDQTGSWTITVTGTNGITCPMSGCLCAASFICSAVELDEAIRVVVAEERTTLAHWKEYYNETFSEHHGHRTDHDRRGLC